MVVWLYVNYISWQEKIYILDLVVMTFFFKTNFISGPNTESEVTLIEGLYYNQSLFFLLSSSSGGRKDISKAGAQKLGQLSDFDLLL